MKRTTFAVIAVIALVLTAGAAAAMPGSAPDNAGADEAQTNNADDAAEDDARDEDGDDVRENRADDARDDDRADAADEQRVNAASGEQKRADNAHGPAVDLPAQVPDHVQKIHDLIGQYLDGELDGSLGDLISGVDRGDAANETAAEGAA